MNCWRVVLDTNCLVSALLFAKGRLSELRTAWQVGRIVPVMCKETASELIRVLAYPKFRLEPEEVRALLSELLPFTETFTLAEPSVQVDGLTDATDAIFIHLARQVKVDWLVSGDSHLLALSDISFIVSPGDFLNSLSK